MTKEIKDKIVDKISEIEHFNIAYDDGKTSNPKEYEDDCFIHISRGKYRFVFYNGQDEVCLTEKDIKAISKKVDTVLDMINIKKGKPIILDVEPKWISLVPLFIQWIKEGNKQQYKTAVEHLNQMAIACDKIRERQKKGGKEKEPNYEMGYNILMDYWNDIPESERTSLHLRLKKWGL